MATVLPNSWTNMKLSMVNVKVIKKPWGVRSLAEYLIKFNRREAGKRISKLGKRITRY